jgi:diguanylate cyclase (GGDEF)-like protein
MDYPDLVGMSKSSTSLKSSANPKSFSNLKSCRNLQPVAEVNSMKKKIRGAAQKSPKPRMNGGKPLFQRGKIRPPSSRAGSLAEGWAGSSAESSAASWGRSSATPAAALTIRRLEGRLRDAETRIAELRASAETDFLLNILNRRGFARELKRAIAYMARYHASGALVMLDVDRLKPINDAFGHAAGDIVLRAVAEELHRHVRASDVIGRLGGDEFVLLLWNLGEADARIKAATLEAGIDGLSFLFNETRVAAGASAGVALLGPDADPAIALAEADRAMYARKRERREASVIPADRNDLAGFIG